MFYSLEDFRCFHFKDQLLLFKNSRTKAVMALLFFLIAVVLIFGVVWLADAAVQGKVLSFPAFSAVRSHKSFPEEVVVYVLISRCVPF
jgi:hypothetical protein